MAEPQAQTTAQKMGADNDEKRNVSQHASSIVADDKFDAGGTGTPKSEQPAADAPAAPAQPKGLKLAVIISCVCVAVFLQALDNNIISTAIPRITSEFNALDDVGWYGSAYFLTTCACQLLWGRLYTFFHLKWMYMTAISIFELGSLICAVAPNSNGLIAGRAIAGFGCAGIFSGSFIIIAFSVPLERRPFFTSMLGVMYGIASVSGPLIGGAFTDSVTWRWCFYINLPLGGLVLAGILLFFKSPAGNPALRNLPLKEKLQKFDILGTALFLASIVCLLLALQWGGTTYAWSNGRIIALLVLFCLGLIGWIGIQYVKGANATVPGRIIFQRSIGFACFNAMCVGGSLFVLIYYIPLWLQAVHGDSAVLSGVHNLPMLLGVTVAEVLVAIGVNRTGYYAPFMILAVVLAATGAGLVSTWNVGTSSAMWIGYQALYGLGAGTGWQQPLLVVQTVLEHADIPTGMAVMLFFQLFGGALFISVAQNVFSNKLAQGLQGLGDGVDAGRIVIAGATGLRDVVSADKLEAVLGVYNYAITNAFYVAVALSSLAIVGAAGVEWRSVKAKKAGGH